VLALIRDQLVTRFDPDAAEETLRARRAATRAEAERLLGAQSSAQRARFDRALDRALIAYPVREDNEFFTQRPLHPHPASRAGGRVTSGSPGTARQQRRRLLPIA
jgi:hypothetical protein